jgi:hypothetical protein
MTRPAAFRQIDVTRALRAASAAGLEVSGYEIDRATGNIVVRTGRPTAPTGEQQARTELDEWIAKHGHKIYGESVPSKRRRGP